MKFECPVCGRQSVEKRGPNIPQNVNRRRIGDKRDKFVCRNQSCKWTGDEDELPYEYEEDPPENHQSVFGEDVGANTRNSDEVAEKRVDGGSIDVAKAFGTADSMEWETHSLFDAE